MPKKLEDIKTGITVKTRTIAGEQGWVAQVNEVEKEYAKKVAKVQEHIDDERKQVKNLIKRRRQLKAEHKQKLLESRLKDATGELGSLQDALKSVADKEKEFKKNKRALNDKIKDLEGDINKLKGQPQREEAEEELKNAKRLRHALEDSSGSGSGSTDDADADDDYLDVDEEEAREIEKAKQESGQPDDSVPDADVSADDVLKDIVNDMKDDSKDDSDDGADADEEDDAANADETEDEAQIEIANKISKRQIQPDHTVLKHVFDE